MRILCAGVLVIVSVLASLAVRADEPAKTSEAAKAPEKVDLRPQLAEFGLPPRPQGSRGTCSVFTTTAAIEYAVARRDGHGTPLSVEYLNWGCNQVINNHADRGQFFHHLLAGFEKYGICAASEMRYRRQFHPEFEPSAAAKEDAKRFSADQFKIHWVKRLGQHPGLREWQFKEVKEALAAGWPVAAGAGHSRLFVGYEDNADQPGGGSFITKDSGIGGYGTVTYEFAKTEVNDAFWVEAAAK